MALVTPSIELSSSIKEPVVKQLMLELWTMLYINIFVRLIIKIFILLNYGGGVANI